MGNGCFKTTPPISHMASTFSFYSTFSLSASSLDFFLFYIENIYLYPPAASHDDPLTKLNMQLDLLKVRAARKLIIEMGKSRWPNQEANGKATGRRWGGKRTNTYEMVKVRKAIPCEIHKRVDTPRCSPCALEEREGDGHERKLTKQMFRRDKAAILATMLGEFGFLTSGINGPDANGKGGKGRWGAG